MSALPLCIGVIALICRSKTVSERAVSSTEGIDCAGRHLNLGTQIAEGKSGWLHEVEDANGIAFGTDVQVVAKVEKIGSSIAFDLLECDNNNDLVKAGIHAPKCFGKCSYATPEGKIAKMILIEKVSGDDLVHASKEHASDEEELVLGGTVAEIDCEELLPKLYRPIAEQFGLMLSKGYANRDQHGGNIMFDDAGVVWLIDQSSQYFTRKGDSEEGKKLWAEESLMMMEKLATQAKWHFEKKKCSDAPRLISQIFSVLVEELKNIGDKVELCFNMPHGKRFSDIKQPEACDNQEMLELVIGRAVSFYHEKAQHMNNPDKTDLGGTLSHFFSRMVNKLSGDKTALCAEIAKCEGFSVPGCNNL